ncbi:glycosyltransferase family 2 protein [Stenotrophomonas sp. Sm10]|uniref:glycosyltransferase family 2 protein n=1 Tax=Stenotrophomonas sp. Sm10 TaxID=3002754 RepID=UPI0012B4B549|nr:glycosyltransferase family 2 protein [Stenotrophomonas sp. Sm10]MDQ7311418.1 glycosyltransferase family 2 protein [Stenotrophomonas sp. Sm10]QGL87255.1 glycosyltransferase family 2 protein [Stenotrophomonas maltophilia]
MSTSLPEAQHSSPPRLRQVPIYRCTVLAPKHRNHAVVIPVINEGERIRSLLMRMKEVGIADIADIIIVDGGSTDGSLAESFLKQHDVSALLVKTGPGKLSAQLRCAYDFCLDAGYTGIVTIDGNNKDDPAPIPAFIEALERGVDFVQASRFISGGFAENTPLSRYIAIRLIHAPLLSLFSGFGWTDTTQGFRAYSRSLLVDPGIDVFRDVFDGYELLAYLSYRAPKLGFRCVELPTARCYPKGEVPTKISSFRGNLKVMQVLLATIAGRYNPAHRSKA